MTQHTTIELPTPSPDEQARSAQLQQIIRDTIAQHAGHISFERYMQMALYYPYLGYYRAPHPKIGAGGDFITAPELSPLFSWSVARQIEQVLRQVPEPVILELGAGTGAMAIEILRELARRECPLKHYYILDISGELQAQQRARIAAEVPEWLDSITWLSALPTSPINGVIVANEVIDAMPVRKFVIDNGVQELYVTTADQQLVWQTGPPADTALTEAVDALEVSFAPGYSSEINLLLTPWIRSLAESLQQGMILLIDYGYPRSEYYHAMRHQGTLMCHYQHRAHEDVLWYPGLQDITCHVDFTAVALAADAAGLAVAGYTHQAAFLVSCGIQEFYEHASDTYAAAQQLKRLTLPSEMGERFKVMALTRHWDEPLLGFTLLDQRARLG